MKGKASKIILVILIILVMLSVFIAGTMIAMPVLKKKDVTIAKDQTDKIKHSYANEDTSSSDSQEITRNYEIKSEETWDVSKNQDGSVMAKWTLSDKVLDISGNGEMKSWESNDESEWSENNCIKLIKKITIEDGVNNIGERAFKECTSVTSVEIPSSVTSIGSSAFYKCSSLTSIEIPDSVTYISGYTFYSCKSLKSITIPDSVTSIGNSAFLGCYFTSENFVNNSNVELDDSSKPTIVDTDDKGFCIKDNELVRMRAIYAIGEITIPNSVTSIDSSAFYCCSSLTSVTIPDGVTSIDDYVFYFCECLMSVTIPTSVKSIGDSAFENCTSLANAYYSGSQSDWNKITIGDSNEDLTNATIHFSSTPTPTPTPTPEPTPTPNPAPQPPTQPTQELPQQAAQQTAQQQSVKNDTAAEQVNVAKPKSANIKKIKAAKKAVSVEWKKVSGVKGYQIQVATDKKFKKNKKTVTVKKQKTTKTTVKKLKAKKKYYVRMRTYKIVNGKKVYSSWSKVKTVKTK